MAQLPLFPDPTLPEGFRYQSEFLTRAEEQALIARFAELPFKPFEFQQYLGKRQVVYFGYRYDYQRGTMDAVEALPDWLIPIRDRAAAFAGLSPARLVQAMVTEYEVGAPIGWHRDRPQFEDIIGISLESPANFRFRRQGGDKWIRAALTVEPRSIYLLRGAAREAWQHSIPPLTTRRYSITFRSLRTA